MNKYIGLDKQINNFYLKQYYKDWVKFLLRKFKKKGACVFWAPVIFLSFLAGKFTTFEQMLLAELIDKIGACSFFSKFFGGKLKILNSPLAQVKLPKFFESRIKIVKWRLLTSGFKSWKNYWFDSLCSWEKRVVTVLYLLRNLVFHLEYSLSWRICTQRSIRDIYKSVCKRKKINDKLI